MATKRVCDRCGAEINPPNSVTYAGMRRTKNDINDNDYELCVSCAHKLRKWFNGEEKDNGRWVPFHSEAAGDIQYCSACEIGFDAKTDYCPHCGAKMEGEQP
jgi:hypothetical protein